MAHTWKLGPKGVPIYRIIQGEGFHQLTDSIKKTRNLSIGSVKGFKRANKRIESL